MQLDPTVSEWLNLALRWIHVFAGIMWVGTTYYFTWLDARLTEEEKAVANTGNPAQIWMVHSGGFYVVEKRKVPDLVSRTLHWFRWEAGTTWLSGFALLVVVYYLGGGALVDRDVSQISVVAAVALGVGVIVVSGTVYDLMMLSPLGRNEKLFA
ncbi:MAG TPA: urate hydroxylase PuuD, partial [Pyrinomonadaceae bacterium]|nr:urate hydroxylase PuuD [Pyrinomonadaceae bacterium]